MRLNKFIAAATGMGRRPADAAIAAGNVTVNGEAAEPGRDVSEHDTVTLHGKPLSIHQTMQTIILNKPAGHIVNRNGHGGKTIYDLLPPAYHHLKPIGRLDKDSSGLLLLTNDGQLAHELTHPGRQKIKVYEIMLDAPLAPLHRQMINDHGILLEDGISKLQLERQSDGDDTAWIVRMHEGRNRQIRRTFAALGYTVTRLHRTQFGHYQLGNLVQSSFHEV